MMDSQGNDGLFQPESRTTVTEINQVNVTISMDRHRGRIAILSVKLEGWILSSAKTRQSHPSRIA